MAHDHAVLLKSGRVILPTWVSHDRMKSTYSFTFYSDDKGHTWKKSNEITVRLPSKGRDTSPAAEEPTIVELKDGGLLMLIRTYVGSFFKSYSNDRGATWSEAVNSGIPAPGAQPTLVRIPASGDLLLLFNYGEAEEINGPWPRTRIASAISRDEGRTFSSIRILDGSPNFKGKITMANVTFSGKNAIVCYSKSPNQRNIYSWMLQVLPTAWFYEGDWGKVYGATYLTKATSAR
jgi:sialidase-1